jgi:hypothetical protein
MGVDMRLTVLIVGFVLIASACGGGSADDPSTSVTVPATTTTGPVSSSTSLTTAAPSPTTSTTTTLASTTTTLAIATTTLVPLALTPVRQAFENSQVFEEGLVLPFEPADIEALWYQYAGRYLLVISGVDAAALGGICGSVNFISGAGVGGPSGLQVVRTVT